MSKQMAQKMKGDIFIESIERVGSRFFVVFPMTEKKS
jgi:signal transduction histidine kinase